jgi:hypothetical protein
MPRSEAARLLLVELWVLVLLQERSKMTGFGVGREFGLSRVLSPSPWRRIFLYLFQWGNPNVAGFVTVLRDEKWPPS